MQRLILDLTQNRIHHDQEPHCNWDRYIDKLAFLEGGSEPGDKVTQDDAERHSKEDPEGEEAVEEGEAFECGEGLEAGSSGAAICMCPLTVSVVAGSTRKRRNVYHHNLL